MTLVETVTKVISEDKKNFKSHSAMDGQVAYKKTATEKSPNNA